jgi:peptide/nickel transport system ATP-binding protein
LRCWRPSRKSPDEFNTAAIYITHDLAVVAQLADRIMVLRYGELVEENDAREMLAPRGRTTPAICWRCVRLKRERAPDLKKDVILEGR